MIRLQPKDAAAYDDRGLAYRMKGEHRPRHRRFQRGGAARSESRRPIYNDRGTAYGMRGDTDRAIADFSAALKLDPGQRGRPQQPRLRPPQQGRHRRGHRRFQRRHQAQARLRRPRSITAAPPISTSAISTRAHRRLQRGDHAQSQASRPPITGAASPTTTRASSIWRSRITARPSSSIRPTRAPTTTAASPIAAAATSTAPSPTTTRRC